jgi:twitching motility protein PilT
MPAIDQFLEVLISKKGSDLHLAVGGPPMLRINGRLKRIEYPTLTQSQVLGLLQEIMNERLTEEYNREWDADFAYEAAGIGRFRVNAFTQKNGAAAVFRVIPTEIPTADDLNLPYSIRQLTMLHKGLVLVTGPTGSGKSTSLAALINLINQHRHSHILTVEDPIEFVHESKRCLVNQREVGVHATSFARALRAGLREDPDVILVGEMRDLETISLALTAAETGHLVFGTLHTSSAAKTIDRIIDSYSAEQQQQIRVQLAEVLVGVIAQTLIPRASGQGRIAAFEILLNNNAVANMIREAKLQQIRSIILTHKKDGMQLMDTALLDLVKAGEIEEEEALSRAVDRRGMELEMDKLAGTA